MSINTKTKLKIGIMEPNIENNNALQGRFMEQENVKLLPHYDVIYYGDAWNYFRENKFVPDTYIESPKIYNEKTIEDTNNLKIECYSQERQVSNYIEKTNTKEDLIDLAPREKSIKTLEEYRTYKKANGQGEYLECPAICNKYVVTDSNIEHDNISFQDINYDEKVWCELRSVPKYTVENILKIKDPTFEFLESLSYTNIDMEPILLHNKEHIEKTFSYKEIAILCIEDVKYKIYRGSDVYKSLQRDLHEYKTNENPPKITVEEFYNKMSEHYIINIYYN